MEVKQVHPQDEGRAKAHGDESGFHEAPVNAVECLFLVQREDGNRRPGRRGVVDNVAQERHVLPDKSPRNPTRLITTDHEVNNF